MTATGQIDLLGAPPRAAHKVGAPSGYKIISVRMRAAEYACFTEAARALSLTNNMALRIAARRIGGFLELDSRTHTELEALSGNIGQTAAALSHLARAAGRDEALDMERFAALRQDFGRDFAVLDDLLRALLNVSRRRRDGRRLLEEAGQS